MHFSQPGEPLIPGQEPHHAPGVRGYAIEQPDGKIYIPLVIADREGSGDVGRWLDTLPKDRDIIFPNIVNQRLGDMLLRRGFFICEAEAQPALGRGPGVVRRSDAEARAKIVQHAMHMGVTLLKAAADQLPSAEAFHVYYETLVATLIAFPVNTAGDAERNEALERWAKSIPEIPRLPRELANDLGVPAPPEAAS